MTYSVVFEFDGRYLYIDSVMYMNVYVKVIKDMGHSDNRLLRYLVNINATEADINSVKSLSHDFVWDLVTSTRNYVRNKNLNKLIESI
jgi:hypothetical protein